MNYVVSSGVTSTGMTLNGDRMNVLNGGSAVSTIVNSDGELAVSSGGMTNATTVNYGGNLYVYTGGSSTQITENGGYVDIGIIDPEGPDVSFTPNSFSDLYLYGQVTATVHSGTTAVRTIIEDGAEMDVYSGGIADSATVNIGGAMRIYEGTVQSVKENGGYVFCGGEDVTFTPHTFSGLVLSEAQSATVHSGTTAVSTILNSAIMEVHSGGSAVATTVNPGGFLFVMEDSNVTEIVENGGCVEVFGSNATFVSHTFSGLVLSDWNTATVHSGTTAADVTVAEGLLQVWSGGSAHGVNVDGGSMEVMEGGFAASTTVTSNIMGVTRGGFADVVIIGDGGSMEVWEGGSANAVRVNSGGFFYVDPDASVFNTVVNDGGFMNCHSNSFVSSTVVNSGGDLSVLAGGIACGMQIAEGASVYMDDEAILLFDLTDRTTADPALVSGLSLIDGTPVISISVLADQGNGSYTLADGAAGFSRTVTISNTDSVSDTLAVGGTVNLSGKDYSLVLASDVLTLTVSGVVSIAADDLNADGRADIVMTIDQSGHPADGSTGAWLIQENQTAAWGDLSTRTSGWEIFGMGWTAAGKSTADVYVRSSDNVIGAWTTGDDGKVTGWETVGEFSAETRIVGLGDFNGNGQSDLLLRNNNGAVGCFFTCEEKHGWNYFQSIGDEWKLSAVGDLNGDGRDDVVLKHDAGFAGCWLTQEDGTMAWADLDTLPAGFEIVGAGDFNGDGTDDVLLKSGSYYGAWLVNNGNAAGWMGLGDLGDVTVEQIADFNGDGKDDLRIRTAAGDIGAQLVMAEDTLDWHYYGAVGEEWKTGLAALS